MSEREAFSAACAFVIPFGKHRGETVASVGASDDGLLYLDWLVGRDCAAGRLKERLDVYLKHPAIANRLDALL